MKLVAFCLLAMAFWIGDLRAEDAPVKSKSKADAKAEHHDGKGSMFAFVCVNKNTIPDAMTLETAFKKWFAQPDEADANNRRSVSRDRFE